MRKSSFSRKICDYSMRFSVFLVTLLMCGSIFNAVDVFNYARTIFPQNSTVGSYTRSELNLLVTSMGVGSLVGMPAFSLLYPSFGARYVLLAAGLCCSFLTAILPWILERSFSMVLLTRFLQGICFAGDFGVIGLVASQWSSLEGLGMTISILSSFVALRDVIQMPINSFLFKLDSPFEVNFYVMAGILLIVSFLWLLVYRDDPIASWANEIEISRINKGKSDAHINGNITVPIKKALSDWRLHGIWLAGFIDHFTSFFWLISAAEFFKAKNFEPHSIPWMISSAGIAFLVAKFVTGFLSDHVKIVSPLLRIRVCIVLSFIGPAVTSFLLVITDGWFTWISLSLFAFFTGVNVGGFYKASLLMYRQYSHFVIGTIQIFKSLSLIVCPLLKNALVTEEDPISGFNLISIGFGVSLLLGAIVLFLAADEKPRK